MNKYENFVIMSDMDGTLINSKSVVSEENKAAIKDFTEQGGSFAVATGRTQHNCINYMEGLAVNTPCIFYNGGALFDWHKKSFIKTCHLETVKMFSFIKDCLATYSGLSAQVYTTEMIYIISNDDELDPELRYEKQNFRESTLDEVKDMQWLKILLYSENNDVLQQCLSRAIEQGLNETSNCFFSAPVYLEFVDKKVSKGHMMISLRQLPAYEGKIFIAVGDFDNDIEMIKRADLGIAAENAQPSVKAAADLVAVSHDDHLLAHIIYKVIPERYGI